MLLRVVVVAEFNISYELERVLLHTIIMVGKVCPNIITCFRRQSFSLRTYNTLQILSDSMAKVSDESPVNRELNRFAWTSNATIREFSGHNECDESLRA